MCLPIFEIGGNSNRNGIGKKKGSPVLPSAKKKHFHNKISNMESINTERKEHSNFEALIENIPKVASTFASALHDQSVAPTIEPQRKALAKKNTDKNTAYGRKRFDIIWQVKCNIIHTQIVFDCEKFYVPSFVPFIQVQDSGMVVLLELSHHNTVPVFVNFEAKNADFKLRARTIKDGLKN